MQVSMKKTDGASDIWKRRLEEKDDCIFINELTQWNINWETVMREKFDKVLPKRIFIPVASIEDLAFYPPPAPAPVSLKSNEKGEIMEMTNEPTAVGGEEQDNSGWNVIVREVKKKKNKSNDRKEQPTEEQRKDEDEDENDKEQKHPSQQQHKHQKRQWYYRNNKKNGKQKQRNDW